MLRGGGEMAGALCGGHSGEGRGVFEDERNSSADREQPRARAAGSRPRRVKGGGAGAGLRPREGEVAGCDRDAGTQVGEVGEHEVAALAGGGLVAGLRVDDAGASPVGAPVGSLESGRVELGAELGHAVFIDDAIGWNFEVFFEEGVELWFCQGIASSLVTAGFHGGASGGQGEGFVAESFEEVEEGEGRAEEEEGFPAFGAGFKPGKIDGPFRGKEEGVVAGGGAEGVRESFHHGGERRMGRLSWRRSEDGDGEFREVAGAPAEEDRPAVESR